MGAVEYKVFRDNVHGYIRVPVDLVRLFIDTEIFQRLRNIEQTGMRILYPSARHDRFIHSLGTFYLGSKAFESFRENTRKASISQVDVNRQHYSVFDEEEKNEIFWDKAGILFEIACLLHDCGHAPFSHTLEFLYDYSSRNIGLTEKLLQYVTSSSFRDDFNEHGTPHERMSALVVCSEYKRNIESLLIERKLNGVGSLSDDIELVVRMIIGCKYETDSKANRIKNCLISLLNSNSIDVDSLDYIVRDSKLSGIDNMSVDVDRLLNSLTLVEKTTFRNKHVQFAEINTNVLEGSLTKKEPEQAAIVAQYQGVIRIEGFFEGKMTGSISAEGHFRIKSNTKFKPANTNVLKAGTNSYTHNHCLPSTANNVDVELFGITGDWLEMTGDFLQFNKEHSGKLECNADIIEIDSAFINGKITGVFTGTLLGCYEDLGGTLTCELGFHKSSLSVIQNVLIARNYEYQWIYSHHKVVYYSNYLIIELFRECIKFILERAKKDVDEYEDVWTNILSWKNMIKGDDLKQHPFEFAGIDYFRPVDSDIYTLFKICRIICMKEDKTDSSIGSLLDEYFSRVYKKSLWKSYAEYVIFFSFLSDTEKDKLYDLILSKKKHSEIDQYGYFEEQWEQKLNQCGLKNVVWVNADSKLKALHPDNTFILFKDTTLNYRTVTFEKDIQAEQKMKFFYIYYEPVNPDGAVDYCALKKFVHEQLKAFL